MATITRRGQGQWQVKIRRKGYPAISATFDTRADAERYARDTERKIDQRKYKVRTVGEDLTLADALDQYEQEVTVHKRGAAQERVRIRYWKAHPYAERSIGNLTTADWRRWRNQRAKQVGPNTIRLDLALISHLYNVARSESDMDWLDNPVQALKLPGGRERRLRTGELRTLTHDARTEPLGPLPDIIRLAVETAMRRGELAALHSDHIDLRDRSIRLPKTKLGPPRIVPLTGRAVRVLRVWLARLQGEDGNRYRGLLIRPEVSRERAQVWISHAFANLPPLRDRRADVPRPAARRDEPAVRDGAGHR